MNIYSFFNNMIPKSGLQTSHSPTSISCPYSSQTLEAPVPQFFQIFRAANPFYHHLSLFITLFTYSLLRLSSLRSTVQHHNCSLAHPFKFLSHILPVYSLKKKSQHCVKPPSLSFCFCIATTEFGWRKRKL